MEKRKLFGCDWKDETLVVNEKEGIIVKWIYRMVSEYSGNPPDFLIQKVIARYRDEGEEITPEEAKEEITLNMVQSYITAELNIRMRQYKDMQGTPEQIQQFLDVQLDETLLASMEEEYKNT